MCGKNRQVRDRKGRVKFVRKDEDVTMRFERDKGTGIRRKEGQIKVQAR